MKTLFMCFVLLFLFYGCKKEEENISIACFKGQYIGNGCWPVIQILSPTEEMFRGSIWQTSRDTFSYAVGVGSLPDKFQDGKPFYFTIYSIDSNLVHNANCNIPKYTISIKNYSDSMCDNSEQ